MKKKILISILIAMVMLSVGGLAKADSVGKLLYQESFNVQVNALVVSVVKPEESLINAGQTFVKIYGIKNYSSTKDYDVIFWLTSNVDLSGAIVLYWQAGTGSYYAPGTSFVVPHDESRFLEISLGPGDYDGNVSISVEFTYSENSGGQG